MSTPAVEPEPPEPEPPEPEPSNAVAAAHRGRLVVAKTVVEKIAAQAAYEVTGVGGRRRDFAVAPGASTATRPDVQVELEGTSAWLSVQVGLVYPAPLRQAAEELRTQLTARVEQLTGITVRRVDIRVSWLGAATEQPRRPR